MKTIPLTRGLFATVDDSDFEFVSKYKWRVLVGHKSNFYAATGNGKNTKLMHRLILKEAMDKLVDHRDGNGLNNQRYNLRVCNARQNAANRRQLTQTKSGYKGVFYHKPRPKRPWAVRVGNQRSKIIYGGYFKTAEEAARRYDELAQQHFGEFANLNFPQKQTP